MPFGNPPQIQGPMSGLAAAKPQDSQSDQQSQPKDPKVLMQAAASLLQEAASQFGPEIIMVIKQLLDSADARPEGAQGPEGMM